MKTRQRYGLHTDPISKYGRLIILPNCNGFSIKNAGSTTIVFMQDEITPGNSKTFGGNQEEVVELNEEISFKDPAVLPPGYVAVNKAIVTQKYFID